MRKLAIVLGVVLVLLVLGHWSGSQPERDAVGAARAELGVDFEQTFVDVGEVTLNVVQAGPKEGPPVYLLHGFPEFWYAWRGPAAVLAREGFRVIVPDQRGYNHSEKPPEVSDYRLDHLVGDIRGLADALGHSRISLAAQDWGGAVAWRFVLDYPDRVERYAVIDAFHPLAQAESTEETISWYRTFIQLPWIPGYSARLFNWALLANNLRATSAVGAFPEAEFDQYRTAWDREGAIHTMGNWYRAEFWPYEGDGRVAVPTLVILAENDAFIPASATRASMAFLDNGTLEELGSGTHWVSGEEPDRIGKLLADFFAPQP